MKRFKESPNTAVYTTKYVISISSPILFVFHDDDGAWQFHGPENNVEEDDMRIIALSEIIEIDNSVLELAEMPPGFEAMRKDKNSPWKIVNSN